MFKRYLNYCASIFLLTSINIHAETLKNSVAESINTHPLVVERLKNYRALQQELRAAEAGFYPKLDLEFSTGVNSSLDSLSNTTTFADSNFSNNYGGYKSALVLTQNLFSGFETKYSVASKEAKILSAAYSYMSVANTIALDMALAYVDVLRYDELLKVSIKNKKISEYIYKSVANRYDSAKTSFSEIKRVESALFLASSESAQSVKKLRDAEFRFRNILGRMPDITAMKRVDFKIPVATNLQEATQYAINNNPLLMMSHYNIKDAQFIHKKLQSNYFPKVNLELRQNYNDVDTINIYEQPDDRFQARFSLKYNFYNGGADSAQKQRSISVIGQEVAKRRAIKRDIIESLDRAWNSYELSKEQSINLQKYRANSEKTLKFFQKEYLSSRRSILELLDAQKDVFYANRLYVDSKYDGLIARYKILDSMGLLVSTLVGDNKRFSSNVNLNVDREATVVLDSPLVQLDIDKDRILDNNDLCDNSILEDNIMPYGCRRIDTFAELQESIDAKIVLPPKTVQTRARQIPTSSAPLGQIRREVKRETPKREAVVVAKKKESVYSNNSIKNGISQLRKSYENDDYAKSSVPSELSILPKNNFIQENTKSTKDAIYGKRRFYGDEAEEISTPKKVSKASSYDEAKCVNVPAGYSVDSDGCATSATISLSQNFQSYAKQIPNELIRKIIEVADFLKKNPKMYAHIVGYSSRTSRSNYDYNIRISKQRADRFKDELVKYGVEAFRLSTDGKGFNNPIADNATVEGREKNQRVEIQFSN